MVSFTLPCGPANRGSEPIELTQMFSSIQAYIIDCDDWPRDHRSASGREDRRLSAVVISVKRMPLFERDFIDFESFTIFAGSDI